MRPLVISTLALIVSQTACGPSGSAPQVQPVEDRVVAVSEELVIRIDASDTDGDILRYSYDTDVPQIRSRATMAQLPIGAGEFRWTPMASDVGEWFFDFKVSDGDYTTTVTVRVEVRSAVGANSAPRFIAPASNGTTLDLSKNRCLELDVIIDDSDSVEVLLEQGGPVIEGAKLVQTDGLQGEWSWCPSPEQINATNRYTLSITADDGENPITWLHYLIILRRPAKDNCPGQAPVITHTAKDSSTLGHVIVEVDISDDLGLKDSPVLFYSETDPGPTPTLSTMKLATMHKTGMNLWTAQLPNPVAGDSAGTSKSLHYLVLARDDDDPDGSCDNETLSPASGSHSMTVTNPGGFGGLDACESCLADAQCGDTEDDLCVLVGSGGASFCLAGCTDGSCAGGYTCSAEPVESIDGAVARQCLPLSQSCDIECEDDSFEDNDNRQQAAQKGALAPGTIEATSCPLSADDDDEDWWEIVVKEDADVELLLVGEQTTDLDLQLYSETGGLLVGSAGFGSEESISICLSPGTYYVRTSANGIGINEYLLEYTTTPSTCSVPICMDDMLEDNDDAASATIVQFDPQGVYEKTDRWICSGDEDWYVANLFDGETLGALIDFVHGTGDLDIGILASDGSQVLSSGVTQTDGELIFYTLDDPTCTQASESCLFYVVVAGFDGAENTYDLTLTVEAPQ